MIKLKITSLVLIVTILISFVLTEETLPVLSKYPVASLVGSGDTPCGLCYRLQPVGECHFPYGTTSDLIFKVIDLCEGGNCVVQGSQLVSGDLQFVIDDVHIQDWISACTIPFQIEYERVPCSQWNGFSDSTLFFSKKCPLIPEDDHLLPFFSQKRDTTQSCTDSSSHCQVCNNGQCSQCESNYFLSKSGTQCVDCSLLEGCNFCQNYQGCAQCSDNYLLVSNSTLSYCSQEGCKQSSYNCLICHYNGCDQCMNNYFKMDLQQPCLPCNNITGCNGICNDYYGCSQCRSGYVEVLQNGMHTCGSTRTKCACSSPPINPSCPFTFTANCVPTTNPPSNAASLDPDDCALWQWNTTCNLVCDANSCKNPKPAPGNCTNPIYTCTPSLAGGCGWDFTCNDTKSTCTQSSCDCGNLQTPLINCQGGVPPQCNCSLTSDGKCIAAYLCPPPVIQCTADPCYNCLNTTESTLCNNTNDINICAASCSVYSSCLYQEDTKQCGWSNTSKYQSCLYSCSPPTISPPSPPPCDPSLSQCNCLAVQGCVYVLFNYYYTTIDNGEESQAAYASCLGESDASNYMGTSGVFVVTSTTPGVRAMCQGPTTVPSPAPSTSVVPAPSQSTSIVPAPSPAPSQSTSVIPVPAPSVSTSPLPPVPVPAPDVSTPSNPNTILYSISTLDSSKFQNELNNAVMNNTALKKYFVVLSAVLPTINQDNSVSLLVSVSGSLAIFLPSSVEAIISETIENTVTQLLQIPPGMVTVHFNKVQLSNSIFSKKRSVSGTSTMSIANYMAVHSATSSTPGTPGTVEKSPSGVGALLPWLWSLVFLCQVVLLM